MTTKKESAKNGALNADSVKTKVVKLDQAKNIKSQISYL